MNKLALYLIELLEISLGVDRHNHNYYRQLFEDSVSIVRCNHYPRCNKPNLTYGVGPHCDPNALTILYQDQVGGLEVFADNKWKSVQPNPNALVVNIGDTFTVHSFLQYIIFVCLLCVGNPVVLLFFKWSMSCASQRYLNFKA
ncbi:putative oxoglutarate/iron-dependent dioxygenase, isopenicillin N synthase [Helianthus debilis subsp. tardiflorus]